MGLCFLPAAEEDSLMMSALIFEESGMSLRVLYLLLSVGEQQYLVFHWIPELSSLKFLVTLEASCVGPYRTGGEAGALNLEERRKK